VDDTVWTVKQLADAAGVSDAHIRRLLGRGTFEGASKRAGAWFVPADVGEKWVKDRWARKWARSVKEAQDV